MNEKIIKDIKLQSNKELALHHLKFFKTAKGEYGEGDLFYGLKMPQIRQIAKKHFNDTDLNDLAELLKNPYHEVRMCALVMMVDKFKQSQNKAPIAKMYLQNTEYINNWDLVDLSAPYILGPFWYQKDLKALWTLAESKFLWNERIAILSSFYFVKQGEYQTTLDLCEYFLEHKHDLIHKATGWMLREVGKRNIESLYGFLNEYYKTMPRIMLRYSIEKLSSDKRDFYMGRSCDG